jgi:hypothetical protein
MPGVGKFIDQLEAIPWFANLGKLSPRDTEVFRIYHWDTWPGPEDPGSEMQTTFQMQWHDNLFKSAESTQEKPDEWKRIYDCVLRLTKASVAYEEQEDVWFGPNAAVVQAAFIAALVGCTILRDGELMERGSPEMQWTLSNEWSWYRAGHWPCMYYWSWGHSNTGVANRTGGAKRLVVY